MHIRVVGAGPAGLLFALLARRRRPGWRIEVVEQNAADATFGFGVVFSQGALAFLERDAPDLHAALAARMESWPVQRIVHRDVAVEVDGNGFSAIGRLELLRFLQRLCAEAGVELHYGRRLESAPDADLVVGADGLNSAVRDAGGFAPQVEWLTNRFVWYGTRRPFDCLTLTFRESAAGAFVAHHYRYAPGMSTFIVECDAATWSRAGLDRMDEAASRAYCERVFAPELQGELLVSNKSQWRRFPLLRNPVWHAANRVLIGDALRSMHFSIGSGTRLAFEDAIALDRALGEAGEDVPAVLAAFERERRPVVEKLFAAASASSTWYEDFPARMARFDALGLAYDYMRRSGRMGDERLRVQAPGFMRRVDAARGRA
jgi:2-polyprenyl-6-methoxyphenol hydroxylase-like FAD-dependent oxidoreductase